MKKYLLPLILILLLTFTLGGYSADWLGSEGEWDYRIELAINDYAGDINGSVTWFPVTIFLKNANGDSTKVFLEVGANSRQIAITKADGTTELKGEIEQWSYDGGTPALSIAVIHTSADGWVINANTSIFLYYKSGHDDNANIDVINTAAGEAVWNAEFVAVYHMVDDNGNIDDSTSNNNDGTKKGANEPIEATGKVGQGQDFDGADDTIDAPAGTIVDTDDFSVSFILRLDTDGSRGGIYQRKDSSPYNGIYFGKGGTNTIDFNLRDTDENIIGVSIAQNLGTLVHYTGIYDKSEKKVYLYENGVEVDTDINASFTQNIGSSGYTTKFGYRYYPGEMLNGLIDETRISSTIRTPAWTKGTYNSLWDSLLTYGSEETEAVAVEVNSIFFGTNF